MKKLKSDGIPDMLELIVNEWKELVAQARARAAEMEKEFSAISSKSVHDGASGAASRYRFPSTQSLVQPSPARIRTASRP